MYVYMLHMLISMYYIVPPMIARPDNPEAVFVPLPEGTPFPLQQPLPVFDTMVGQTVTVPRGSVVVIRCQVTGSPEPTITWFVNGVMSMEMAFGANFTIEGVQPDDAGTYECRANSMAGSDTLTTTLNVVCKSKHVHKNDICTHVLYTVYLFIMFVQAHYILLYVIIFSSSSNGADVFH